MSERDENRKLSREISLGGISTSQLLLGLAIFCGLVAFTDFRHFMSHDEHHGGHEPHVRFESWFNFFGFASILATVVMVFIAKLLGGFLSRGEGYYNE